MNHAVRNMLPLPHNNRVNAAVRPVTPLAVASASPVRAARYAVRQPHFTRRWADVPTGENMRMPSLLLVTAALVTSAGCGQAREASAADSTPIPTTVNCADLSQLKERAVDARRRSAETTRGRARIIAGSRAKFAASLASIAQLKCRTSVPEADAMLGKAIEIARGADATRSEYEAAHRWTEADLIATDAIALLVGEIPPAAPQ